MRFIFLFISLLAQRNEPKKGHPVSLVPPLAGYPVLLDAAGDLKTRLRITEFKSLFGSLSGARLRANGILTAMTPEDLADLFREFLVGGDLGPALQVCEPGAHDLHLFFLGQHFAECFFLAGKCFFASRFVFLEMEYIESAAVLADFFAIG
ncbi:MAG: hypothetical protein NTW42_09540 [Deltaproteobacteria bacterium]|nr:hypothetical protein [Deltaproteobacteria bacterium]